MKLVFRLVIAFPILLLLLVVKVVLLPGVILGGILSGAGEWLGGTSISAAERIMDYGATVRDWVREAYFEEVGRSD